ncbi:hypothetical protein IWX50DRAFT_172724 [Phyllosticta citricarpa]
MYACVGWGKSIRFDSAVLDLLLFIFDTMVGCWGDWHDMHGRQAVRHRGHGWMASWYGSGGQDTCRSWGVFTILFHLDRQEEVTRHCWVGLLE